MRILSIPPASKAEVLAALERPTRDFAHYRRQVRPILEAVRREGDPALLRFSRQFDGVEPVSIRVHADEPRRALEALPGELRRALETAQGTSPGSIARTQPPRSLSRRGRASRVGVNSGRWKAPASTSPAGPRRWCPPY